MRRLAFGLAPLFAVFCVTACQTVPPSQATLTLATTSTPLGLGQNTFEVTLTDPRGDPIGDAEVHLVLVMPADPATKHPEMRTEGQLRNMGGGKYSGIAMVTMAGAWDVSATAVRDGKPIGSLATRLTAVVSRRTSDQ